MTNTQVAVQLAVVAAALAYVLPLIMKVRHTSTFPKVFFFAPAVCLLAWLVAEHNYLGPSRIGHTFYGAIPVAVSSNILILSLWHFGPFARASLFIQTLVLLLLCVGIGIGLRIFLPGIPD